jgi:hypothetical protein
MVQGRSPDWCHILRVLGGSQRYMYLIGVVYFSAKYEKLGIDTGSWLRVTESVNADVFAMSNACVLWVYWAIKHLCQ